MNIDRSDQPHDIEFADGSVDGTRETADPESDQDLPLIPGDDPAPDAKPDDYDDPQIYPES